VRRVRQNAAKLNDLGVKVTLLFCRFFSLSLLASSVQRSLCVPTLSLSLFRTFPSPHLLLRRVCFLTTPLCALSPPSFCHNSPDRSLSSRRFASPHLLSQRSSLERSARRACFPGGGNPTNARNAHNAHEYSNAYLVRCTTRSL